MKKRVLSLGGGVQSTVMALLAARGDFDPPEIGIFADTGWEPAAVYETIGWLMKEVTSYPIVVTRAYSGSRNAFINLREDVKSLRAANGKFGAINIPVYGINKRGKRMLLTKRQCTTKYKINAVNACARGLLYTDRPLHRRRRRLVQLLGISTDEALRAKTNRHACIDNEYPLIDLGVSRRDCLAYMSAHYPDRMPTRSACVACPYRSAREWAAVKAAEPALFAEAVELDVYLRDKIRNANVADTFLHRRCIPLDEAAHLTSAR